MKSKEDVEKKIGLMTKKKKTPINKKRNGQIFLSIIKHTNI